MPERERGGRPSKNWSYFGIREASRDQTIRSPMTKTGERGTTRGRRSRACPFGTTNRFLLISIAAARTKATRLLYLRIDHARIYTSIRSALVLLLAPPLLFAPLHLRPSFPPRFLIQPVRALSGSFGRPVRNRLPAPPLPLPHSPLFPPLLAAECVFR